jgi:hypothetical protein
MENDGIKYITGLDLGQAAEFTALAVLEQTIGLDPQDPVRDAKHYAVRHLERFALGTPFPEVCARLRDIFAEPPLMHSTLTVDQTAVGEPVLELLSRAHLKATIRPVTITAGHQARVNDDGGWSVPKKDLVSTLQVLLQSRRIKVAPRLRESQTLVKELLNFRTKASLSANETLEAWREGPHDDLVLAVAIAAWQSEHLREFWYKWW